MFSGKLKIERLEGLRPHEEVDSEKVLFLIGDIEKNGIHFPITADKTTGVILDGHHRFAAFMAMGMEKIPVFYVDYMDSKIILDSWNGIMLTKSDVIAKAVSGGVFPQKTTKHMVSSAEGESHIMEFLPNIELSLDDIRASE